MKKLFSFAIFLFLFVSLQTLPSYGQSQEPKELTEARNSYNVELQKATKPVNDRYLPKLEELKKQLTFKGDIKGAVAIEDVITKMSSSQPLEQQGDKDPQELKEIKKNYMIELATAIIVLSIENYTFNRMFNHKFMIYNDKYQFSLSHV